MAATWLACEPPAPPAPRTARPLEHAAPPAATEPIPKVDVHLHIDLRAADDALQVLAESGIVVGLNASGGEPGRGLEQSAQVARSSGGRLLPLCNLRLAPFEQPGYAEYVAASLARCRELGGKGLKISKALGLGYVDSQGKLVAVDDPRLDVIFDTAGQLGLPVLLHSGDPKAFFEPPTADNERYDELRVHPSWSFHGRAHTGQPWPSWRELLEQHERRVARHPGTIFVGAHFGNAAEEPERVARMLREHANYVIDTAARVPEFGRHAAERMRAFFVEHPDRILFGSDLGVGPEGYTLGSGGERPDARQDVKPFFDRHWLYFESREQRMAHPTPIQGPWTVDAIGLPRAVLEKLYFRNALRVFGLSLPTRP